MINPYVGEFLINPCPLELSFNYCSHKCSYCFANLNQPNRKFDALKVMRFIAHYKERNTLAAHLLKQGYPVVVSNKVDPFASSNYLQSVPVLEVLTALGIPVQIQTKGGRGVDKVLSFLPPSVWYISISTLNDDIRRQCEPGAPPIKDRLALIEQVLSLGHSVVVGINPCIPEWLPNPIPLVKQLKSLGVWGVWVETLHLSNDQIANMKAKERHALDENIIKRARKRKNTPQDETIFHATRQEALSVGLEIFSVGQPNRSDFFKPYHQTYKKTFQTLQGFINRCYGLSDNLISFNQMANFMQPCLPSGKHGIGHYLGATSRVLYKKYHIPNLMSYRQLLGILWRESGSKYSIVKWPNFAYAALKQDQQWTQLLSENHMPWLLFSSRGFKNYFHDVRLEA